MARSLGILPGMVAFLAGIAAATLTSATREKRVPAAKLDDEELKSAVAKLEAHIDTRLSAQESANSARFSTIEAKLEEHAERLADVPSTTQIVTAMEQILARTMSSLDERLNSQARSIDTLKTTVAQTDGLLERVLESLDSLQNFNDPTEFKEDKLLHQRPA